MQVTIVRRSAEYLYKLCVAGSTHPEQIPPYVQKARAVSLDAAPPMPKKISPEAAGLSSRRLLTLLHALEADPRAHIHSLLVSRRGRLLLSASAPAYSPRIPHLTHSMAKTITSFAVAILVGDGVLHLDDKLVDIFADELPRVVPRRTRTITVRHLLTMTAGVTGVSEAASVTITDWRQAFLSDAPSFTPGTQFFYNSMNTYMLAEVVEKLSGRTLEDFLKERLLTPLGITEYAIEKGPDGVAKGGWGMYIAPLDLLKLGEMVVGGGVFRGRRILPADYVQEAVRPQVSVRADYGDYDYGYHLWVARDGSAVLFNGMLGQNVWCGKNGVVAVSTAGNDEFFQQSSSLRAIAAALKEEVSDAPRLPDPTARRALRRAEEDFFCHRARTAPRGRHEDVFSPAPSDPLPAALRAACGTYYLEKNSAGLMPLAWRIMQNHHAAGIRAIAPEAGDELTLTITEGDTAYRIPCGFGAYRYSTVTYGGEPYLLAALCLLTENEDGERLLRFDLVFPELPNSRRIKLYGIDTGAAVFALTETPGVSLVGSALGSLISNAVGRPTLYQAAERHLSDRLVRNRLLHCMEPVLYATRAGAEDEEAARAAAAWARAEAETRMARRERLFPRQSATPREGEGGPTVKK